MKILPATVHQLSNTLKKLLYTGKSEWDKGQELPNGPFLLFYHLICFQEFIKQSLRASGPCIQLPVGTCTSHKQLNSFSLQTLSQCWAHWEECDTIPTTQESTAQEPTIYRETNWSKFNSRWANKIHLPHVFNYNSFGGPPAFWLSTILLVIM